MILIDPGKLEGCKLCTTDQFPRDRRVEGWNDCIEYLQKCCVHVPVVEVVQCKDCKHHYDSIHGYVICKLLCSTSRADGYCHNGTKADAEVEG